jgi:hypothetical protein
MVRASSGVCIRACGERDRRRHADDPTAGRSFLSLILGGVMPGLSSAALPSVGGGLALLVEK